MRSVSYEKRCPRDDAVGSRDCRAEEGGASPVWSLVTWRAGKANADVKPITEFNCVTTMGGCNGTSSRVV